MKEYKFSIMDSETKIILSKNGKDTLAIRYNHFNYDWIGKSSSYYSERGFLDFKGTFCITLTKIDSLTTNVKVSIENMSILFGRYYNFHCNCCAYNEIHVKTNSVEEYKFLLKLGELIGEANMPKLILPN